MCYEVHLFLSDPMPTTPRLSLLLRLVGGLILITALWVGLKMAAPYGEDPAGETAGPTRIENLIPTATTRPATQTAAAASGNWSERLNSIPNSQERQIYLSEQAGLLQGAELVSLLLAALQDTDVEVRRDVLQLCGMLNEKEIDQAILQKALFDASETIRELAQHRVNELRNEDRMPYFEMMLNSSNEALAIKAAEYLGGVGGKSAVSLLISAFDKASSGKFFETVKRSLRLLTGEDFRDAKSANAWWLENRNSFDG